MIRETSKILEIKDSRVEKALTAELLERIFSTEREYGGSVLVYLASLDTAERLLAERIILLSKTAWSRRLINPERACHWVENLLKLTLGKEQRETLKKSLLEKVFVITGGARCREDDSSPIDC